MATDEEFRAAQGVERQRSTSTDVFRLLPHLSWRGVVYPVSARNVSFRHEQIEHKIQYQGNDFIESLGPHSRLFKYTFPMRQDIARGPYANLFSEGLPWLIRDVYDRTPGELIDPIWGTFRCVPVSLEESTDIGRRDGVDVSVEFIHSPELDEEISFNENITGIEGLTSNAGALDEELKAVDWNQEPSPEGLTDILSAINGVGQRGLRQVDRLNSRINDLTFRLQKIEETTDRAENPQNWQLRDSVRRALDTALRLKKRVTENPAKKVARISLRYSKTLSVIAAENGMTIKELLDINPELGSQGPVVAGGTSIKVTRGNRQSKF